MKKKVTIVLVIISIVAISTMIMFSTYKSSEACRKANAAIQWDCSVTCAEESTPDSYVITYSDAKILSKTGVLTVQNRNDFDIIVHLRCEGDVGRILRTFKIKKNVEVTDNGKIII